VYINLRVERVCFISADEGWATGMVTGSPAVRETEQGWIRSGYSVGGAAIYHTADGGAHWTKLCALKGRPENDPSASPPLTYFGVTFCDARTGWVLLVSVDTLDGYLCRTTDGGQTFTQVSVIRGGRPSPVKLCLSGENTGWIGTDQGAGPICDGLMRTSDGGKTFDDIFVGQDQTCQANCDDVMFLSPAVGFALGIGGEWNGYVARTVDGGQTWTVLTGASTAPPPVGHPTNVGMISHGGTGMYNFYCFGGAIYQLAGNSDGAVLGYDASEVSAGPIGKLCNPLYPDAQDMPAVYGVNGAPDFPGASVPRRIAVMAAGEPGPYCRADYFTMDTVTCDGQTYRIAPVSLGGMINGDKLAPYAANDGQLDWFGETDDGYIVYAYKNPPVTGALAVDIPGMTCDLGGFKLYPMLIPD